MGRLSVRVRRLPLWVGNQERRRRDENSYVLVEQSGVLASLSARRSRVQIPPGALEWEGWHGMQTGKATRLKPGDPVGSTPTRATRGSFTRVVLLTAACKTVAMNL